MRITLTMLRDHGACIDQTALFHALYEDSVEVTEATCLAVASLFNWEWAARHFLAPPAWKTYMATIAPAKQAFDEALALAFARASSLQSKLDLINCPPRQGRGSGQDQP